MNWFKENKFLTGFLAVVVLVAAALAFLMISAQGAFSTAEGEYTAKTDKLKALQSSVPYPEAGNAKKLRDQAKELDIRNSTLQAQLASMEIPLEPVSPERFQDVLKDTVRAVLQKAAENKVEVPQKFFLGFDPYETAPPPADAAPLLARQLKAMAFVVNRLIDARVAKIESVERPVLPAEGGAKPTPAPAPVQKGTGAARSQKTQVDLFKTTPFEVTILAEQEKVRRIMNDISSAKSPFLIMRAVRVENENPKGPPRAAAAAAVAPVGEPGAAPQPAASSGFSVLVGGEKVRASMRIEIVDFADPVEPARAK